MNHSLKTIANSLVQSSIERSTISDQIQEISDCKSLEKKYVSKYSKCIESMGNDFWDITLWKRFYEDMVQLLETSNTVKFLNQSKLSWNSWKLKRYIIQKFWLYNGISLLFDIFQTKKNIKWALLEIEKTILHYGEHKENSKLSTLKVIKTTVGFYLYKILEIYKEQELKSTIHNQIKYSITHTLLEHSELAIAFGSFYLVDDVRDGDIKVDESEKQIIISMISQGLDWINVNTLDFPKNLKLAHYLRKQLAFIQKKYPFELHNNKRSNLKLFFQAQLYDAELTLESTIEEVQLRSCLKATLTRICVREFSTGKDCNSKDFEWFIVEGAINQASNDFRSCLTDKHRTIFTNTKEWFSIFLTYLLKYYHTSPDKEIAGTYIKLKLISYINHAMKQPWWANIIYQIMDNTDIQIINWIKEHMWYQIDNQKFKALNEVYKIILWR